MDIDKKRYLGLSTRERASRIEGLTRSFVVGARCYAFARVPYSIEITANISYADKEIARMKKELTDEMNSFCEEIEELRKLTLRDAQQKDGTAHRAKPEAPDPDSEAEQP